MLCGLVLAQIHKQFRFSVVCFVHLLCMPALAAGTANACTLYHLSAPVNNAHSAVQVISLTAFTRIVNFLIVIIYFKDNACT